MVGGGQTVLDMELIGVANTDETRTLIGKMISAVGDASEPDKSAGELVRRSGGTVKNSGRNDVE